MMWKTVLFLSAVKLQGRKTEKQNPTFIAVKFTPEALVDSNDNVDSIL